MFKSSSDKRGGQFDMFFLLNVNKTEKGNGRRRCVKTRLSEFLVLPLKMELCGSVNFVCKANT